MKITPFDNFFFHFLYAGKIAKICNIHCTTTWRTDYQDSNVDGCARMRIRGTHTKGNSLAADSNCSICGEKSLILKCSIGCSLVFPNINERSDQDTKASTALWANLAAFGSHQ